MMSRPKEIYTALNSYNLTSIGKEIFYDSKRMYSYAQKHP